MIWMNKLYHVFLYCIVLYLLHDTCLISKLCLSVSVFIGFQVETKVGKQSANVFPALECFSAWSFNICSVDVFMNACLQKVHTKVIDF
jgi:hypothetical protein